VFRRLSSVATALLVVFAAGAADAADRDLARGKQLYQLCAVCHGVSGEGKMQYNAPVIGGLPAWYLERQLGNFKQGIRVYRAEDTTGLQMKPMARSLVTEGDVKAVAAYAASLRPALPPANLGGDPARGQACYATCLACHGPQASGNEALGAPALARQADWYLVAQIKKFKQGLRGAHPKDATGAQMRPMAMILADEQAMADVAAYIRTLGQ